MTIRPRFKPVVTKIKLNPEQAVLACSCWRYSKVPRAGTARRSTNVCKANSKVTAAFSSTCASGSIS